MALFQRRFALAHHFYSRMMNFFSILTIIQLRLKLLLSNYGKYPFFSLGRCCLAQSFMDGIAHTQDKHTTNCVANLRKSQLGYFSYFLCHCSSSHLAQASVLFMVYLSFSVLKRKRDGVRQRKEKNKIPFSNH